MTQSDYTELQCPQCGGPLARITLEVSGDSPRVNAYLIEQLIPVADGLRLHPCNTCSGVTDSV